MGLRSREYMRKMKIPDGLLELGYAKEDIPDLVKGAIPQVKHILLCHLSRVATVHICILSLQYVIVCTFVSTSKMHIQ